MSSILKERNHRKPKEPKELLVFFPRDYSAVKLSKNKILGTSQQRSALKENTWVEVDIGDKEPWKGHIIKTGQSRNELGRSEISFLSFMHRHAHDKENIPLNDFFSEMRDSDSDEDLDSAIETEIRTTSEINKGAKKTTPPKKVSAKRAREDDPITAENKKEKKLKREQALAQAKASKRQSDAIFKNLEEYLQRNDSEDEDNDHQAGTAVCESREPAAAGETNVIRRRTHQTDDRNGKPDNLDISEKLKEMFAVAIKGLHDRFDKMEELIASKFSGKKISRPFNVVVSHSPRSPHTVVETPEKQARDSPQHNTPEPQASGSTKTSGYIGHKKFNVQASPEVIKRAEEQARGVPKSLAFNLLNILVDQKTQAESNISGQNGKRPLDKNILQAIQSHLAQYFEWTEEQLDKNWRRDPINIQQRIADKCRNLNKKQAKQ